MFDKISVYYKQVKLLVESLNCVGKVKCFALKGGTAINMFIGDLPRLSVDIDLVYLPIETREKSLYEISHFLEIIAQDIKSSIKNTKVDKLEYAKDKTILKLIVHRDSVRIKIEVSPVARGVVEKPSIMQVKEKVEKEFGFAEANIVHINDLYAGKICAALDRQHPRDFFDIKELLENDGLSEKLMDVFIVYLISSNQSISKLLKPNIIDIEKIYNEQFVGMSIRPISLSDLELTRVKLINKIHSKLTQKHREFLLGFKKGNPNWNLLTFENAKELPAVKWKMQNLEKMSKQKRVEAIKKLEYIL